MRVGPGLGVVVIRSQFQTQFQFCRVPRMGGIKLQLLCGVRIELAVGTLPSLALARNPSRSLPIPRSAWRRGDTNTPTSWAWDWTPPGAYPQLDLGSGAHSNKQTKGSQFAKTWAMFLYSLGTKKIGWMFWKPNIVSFVPIHRPLFCYKLAIVPI